MDNEEFLRLCKAKVAEYTNSHIDVTDRQRVTVHDVYVVWSCKTLQNNKTLLSTTVPDGMYYELTYNGDKNELYMDAYKNPDITVCDQQCKMAGCENIPFYSDEHIRLQKS